VNKPARASLQSSNKLISDRRAQSLLLEPILRHALLGAVIFVRQELAGHDHPHAVALRMRLPVDLEVEVDRRHDAVAEFLLDQRL
jgi:hypothetical protein